MFLLGMLVMWVIIGALVFIAVNLDVDEDIILITAGGFWFMPLVLIKQFLIKRRNKKHSEEESEDKEV